MTNRFMISVAALSLIAGTGLANAQGTMGREGGSAGGQQMQHSSQPSSGAAERGGTMGKDSMSNRSSAKESTREKGTVGQAGGSATTKSGATAEEKSSGTMNKNSSAEERSGATKGQRTDEHAQGQQERSKSMSSETQTKSSKDMKAEGREGRGNATTGENRQGAGANTNMNAEGRSGTNATVGQAGAAGKLSTEQRTQITSVIREERVAPVTHVNFSVSVGTRIPREGIELHALPSRVVTIYPEWRTYRYVLVRDEIVIVNPDTYEIVAVLNT